MPPREGRHRQRLYTLLGQHSRAFVALLAVWIMESEGTPAVGKHLDAYFVAHMNRGVEILAARVRSLADIASLLPLGETASASPKDVK